MPQRSKVHTELPTEIKAELDQRLIQSGFGGYTELATWLNEQGFEISRSAIARYGDQLSTKIEAITTATEQARTLAEAIPDDENLMLDAAFRLAQQQIYQVMLDMEFAPSTVTIDGFSRLIRSLADMGRGSISLKKYQQDVRQQVKAAKEKVTGIAKKGGLGEAAIAEIELELGGIG